jgi:hypothetical protein
MATQKRSTLKLSSPAHAKSDRRGRQAGSVRRWPRLWVALAAVALVSGALAVLLYGGSRPTGYVTAAQQTYDFGKVPMHGGLITTRFPFTVEGEVLVTELASS